MEFILVLILIAIGVLACMCAFIYWIIDTMLEPVVGRYEIIMSDIARICKDTNRMSKILFGDDFTKPPKHKDNVILQGSSKMDVQDKKPDQIKK